MNLNPLRPPCARCGEPVRLVYEPGWIHADTDFQHSNVGGYHVAAPNLTSVRYLAGCMVLGGFVFAALLAIVLATALLADAIAQSEAEARQHLLEEARDAALEAWGVHGLDVTVELGQPSQPSWRAEAWPTANLGPCRIVVHPVLAEAEWRSTIVHEVGHCLGWEDDEGRPHSTDVGSVMYPAPAAGQRITAQDRAIVRGILGGWLSSRAVLVGVGR